MSAALRFNAMHFMPYVYLPENHKKPEQLPLLNFVYVAESDEQAEREYIIHLPTFLRRFRSQFVP